MNYFKFVKGSNFVDADNPINQLEEGYIVRDHVIEAQVSAEHIESVFRQYITAHKDTLFFMFLEVPLTIDEEKALQEDNHEDSDQSSHSKVYYLDSINYDECCDILDVFGEVLINDGLSAFGFGTRTSEIGKYKYNKMVFHTEEDITLGQDIFRESNVAKKEDVVFATHLMSDENPGVSTGYADAAGHTIYNVVKSLKNAGLYEASIVESTL